ncbi:MAG: hypothetical protein ACLQRM_16360 [Acidimicrobiales bacterium]
MTDWTAAIAAGATALAAAVTAWMAVETHRVAGKTKEAAEATTASAEATSKAAKAAVREARAVERQLEVSTQPWLSWVSDTGFPEDGSLVPGVYVVAYPGGGPVVGALAVQNVGRGLALIRVTESQLLGGGNRNLERLASLKTSNPVLAPSESTWLHFEVANNTVERGPMTVDSCTGRGVRGNGLFAVDVVYSDSAGAVTYTARFQVVPRDPDPGFVVFQIEYFREEEEEPLATVRVDSPLPKIDI